MKNHRIHLPVISFLLVGALWAPLSLPAEEDPHHDHSGHAHAGPNGGRILHSVEPHLEFLVLEDRKIQLTFLDDHGKAVPASGQVVTAIGGDRSNPTRMNFSVENGTLISDLPLPEGENLPIVLQIKPAPDAEMVLERFNVNLAQCPTCEFKEYACICEH